MLAVILFFDAINEIPFSRLRLMNRPRRCALIKIMMILTNVAIVCFFFILCPWMLENGIGWVHRIYHPDHNLSYLIVPNIISSGMDLILLLTQTTTVWRGVGR